MSSLGGIELRATLWVGATFSPVLLIGLVFLLTDWRLAWQPILVAFLIMISHFASLRRLLLGQLAYMPMYSVSVRPDSSKLAKIAAYLGVVVPAYFAIAFAIINK